MTAPTNKEDNWYFPVQVYSREHKRLIVATMVQIGVLTMMNTHLYEFNGRIYLQQSGGPIGLRATCAVARVVMNFWDGKWKELMTINNIKRDLEDRYMDDIRVILMAIRLGWRWHEGGLFFCSEWEREDQMAGKTVENITAEILIQSMNDILSFLRFTKEVADDFHNKKLPTLDTEIWVENGLIMFEFYEKPMSNNIVVQEKSALSESVKTATLTEEVVRRLKHTSQDLPLSRRLETLEELSTKMATSGHKPQFMKRILTSGIIKYERKIRANKLDPKEKLYKPLYQPSGRQLKRLKKKCLGKDNWYMGTSNKEDDL